MSYPGNYHNSSAVAFLINRHPMIDQAKVGNVLPTLLYASRAQDNCRPPADRME